MLIKCLQKLMKSSKFKEYTYHQKSINKLLMILDYFNRIYKIGDQKIIKLVNDARYNCLKFKTRKRVHINRNHVEITTQT